MNVFIFFFFSFSNSLFHLPINQISFHNSITRRASHSFLQLCRIILYGCTVIYLTRFLLILTGVVSDWLLLKIMLQWIILYSITKFIFNIHKCQCFWRTVLIWPKYIGSCNHTHSQDTEQFRPPEIPLSSSLVSAPLLAARDPFSVPVALAFLQHPCTEALWGWLLWLSVTHLRFCLNCCSCQWLIPVIAQWCSVIRMHHSVLFHSNWRMFGLFPVFGSYK